MQTGKTIANMFAWINHLIGNLVLESKKQSFEQWLAVMLSETIV